MQLLQNIKNLSYGNLNRENLAYTNKQNIFTEYIPLFMLNPYHKLEETEKEISEIIRIQNEYIQKPNWRAYKKFMELCDTDIAKVLFDYLNKIGVDFNMKEAKKLEDIQEKLGVLVMELKQIYQRPRPYQMAHKTGQSLHPFNTISGNSPSYPSGHATQSRFLLKIVAHKNPQYKNQIKKLADDIAFSRIVMGVHYPQDNNFGKIIADELATQTNIKNNFFSYVK